MATTRNVSVGPGKTYASLGAALSNESKNLVSADRVLVITCYPMVDVAVTSAQFGTWTTDATRYLEIRGSEGVGPGYDTTKYRIAATGTDCLKLGTINNLLLRDLQFFVTGNAASPSLACVNSGTHAAGAITAKRCVFRSARTAGTQAVCGLLVTPGGAVWTQQNLLFVGGQFDFGTYWNANPTVLALVDACTFVDCYRVSEGAAAVTNVQYRNCGSAGANGSWASAPYASGSKNNAQQSGTPPGTSPRSSVTPTFVNAAAGDYHLTGGDTAWRDQGADLSASFTDDIEAAPRVVPWDIGCSEYATVISSFTSTVAATQGGHQANATVTRLGAGSSTAAVLTILAEE